jgi:hypothetical protein
MNSAQCVVTGNPFNPLQESADSILDALEQLRGGETAVNGLPSGSGTGNPLNPLQESADSILDALEQLRGGETAVNGLR